MAATKTRLTRKKDILVQLDAEKEQLQVSVQSKTDAEEIATAACGEVFV